MKDTDRRRMLEHVAMEATRLALALGVVHEPTGTTVLDRIRQAEPGIRAAAFDRARGARGVSDPTGREAAGGPGTGRVDPTVGVLGELDRAIRELMSAEDRIVRLLAGFGPPRRANEADRLALARENRRVPAGCESCARIPAGDGSKDPYFAEVDPRFAGGTQVVARGVGGEVGIRGGVPRLAEPMRLCSWCYDFVRNRWRLPTAKRVGDRPSELEMKRDQKPLRMPADEERQIAVRTSARVAEHARYLAEQTQDTQAS